MSHINMNIIHHLSCHSVFFFGNRRWHLHRIHNELIDPFFHGCMHWRHEKFNVSVNQQLEKVQQKMAEKINSNWTIIRIVEMKVILETNTNKKVCNKYIIKHINQLTLVYLYFMRLKYNIHTHMNVNIRGVNTQYMYTFISTLRALSTQKLN